MLFTELTVFAYFNSFAVVLFIFESIVISLFAFSAYESNFDSCIISHATGTSIFNYLTAFNAICVPPSSAAALFVAKICATKKDLHNEVA